MKILLVYGIVGSVRFVRSIILNLIDNCFYAGRIQREQDIDCEPAGWPIAEEGLNEGFICAVDSTSACLRKIDEVKTKRIKIFTANLLHFSICFTRCFTLWDTHGDACSF